jgi:hypothetical protein
VRRQLFATPKHSGEHAVSSRHANTGTIGQQSIHSMPHLCHYRTRYEYRSTATPHCRAPEEESSTCGRRSQGLHLSLCNELSRICRCSNKLKLTKCFTYGTTGEHISDKCETGEVWLVMRRNITTGEVKFYLSCAPVETELTTLVRMSGMRSPIETCFEDGKQFPGMGDSAVRSWMGRHHRMTLCISAHHFLVRVQQVV